MPVMKGLQSVTAVPAGREWRNVTLKLVTTESEHGRIVPGLVAGAQDWVIKPFTPQTVIDKLAMLGLWPASTVEASA